MRWWTSTVVAAALILAAQSGAAQDRRTEQSVRDAQTKRLSAASSQDVTTLESLVDDHLTYCHADGTTETKSSYLDTVRTGRLRWLKVDREEVDVQMYGDTAVINSRLHQLIGTPQSTTELVMNVRTIEVYVRRNSQWKLAHFQATRLPDPPKKD